MKLKRTQLFQHNHGKAAILVIAAGISNVTWAGFQYNPRDLIIGIRQDGGSFELAVNAGQVSTYYSLANGTTVTIANLSQYQLTNAFPDLNNLYWSAAADVRTTGDATYPLNTLWVTRPRDDFNTQTTPWNRQSQFAQGNSASKIDGIANGAVTYGNQVPSDAKNTATGIILLAGDPTAYSTFIGANGNYNNAFQGDVEYSTAPDFQDAGTAARADFYQLKPGTGAGTYLGYFEFKTNGVLTYTSGAAVVTLPPRPSITNIDRNGSTTTISFTTIVGAHYTLKYSTSLSAPVGSWTTSGSPVTGDGTEQSIADTTTDGLRFYVISAAP
jgi:hypothetical protein